MGILNRLKMHITSGQGLSGHKSKILLGVALLAGLPLWLQGLGDIFSLRGLFPLWLMVLCATVVQMAAAPLYLSLPGFGGRRIAGAESLVALASTTAWFLSLVLWVGQGAAAGAAFSAYGALLVTGALAGRAAWTQPAPGDGEPDPGARPELPLTARIQRGLEQDPQADSMTLAAGDLVLVEDGELIPIDGVIVGGVAEIDSGLLNGDPLTWHRGPGDVVRAGERCFGGSIRVEARREARDSMLWQSVTYAAMHESAKASRPPLADRLASHFFVIGPALGLLVFGFWSVSGGLMAGLEKGLAVVALTAPAALGLASAIPMTLARRLLDSNRAMLADPSAIERCAGVETLILGHRDFLVLPEPGIDRMVVVHGSEERLISIAEGLFREVEHPLAGKFGALAERKGLEPMEFIFCQHEEGRGVSGTRNGVTFLVGNPTLLSHHGVGYRELDEAAADMERKGRQVLWVAQAGARKRPLGIIGLGPVLRNGAREAMTTLKGAGISVRTPALPSLPQRLASVIGFLPEIEPLRSDGPGALARTIAEDANAGRPVAVAASALLDAGPAAAATISIGSRSGPGALLKHPDLTVRDGDIGAVATVLLAMRGAGRQMRQNTHIAFVLASVGMMVAGLGLAVPAVATLLGFSGVFLVLAAALPRGGRKSS